MPLEALLGALHATEHAQIAVLPLIAMCDRWDIGGLSTNFHPQTGAPTIFIYDGHPGGIGIARTAFARFEELCEDARRLIAECPCASGCPSCVQSPKCGNLNEPLSKAGALTLLERLLAARQPRSRRRSDRRRLLKDAVSALHMRMHAIRDPVLALALAAALSRARAGRERCPPALAPAPPTQPVIFEGPGGRMPLTRLDAAQRPGEPRPRARLAARRLRRQRASACRTSSARRRTPATRARATTKARSRGIARASKRRSGTTR